MPPPATARSPYSLHLELHGADAVILSQRLRGKVVVEVAAPDLAANVTTASQPQDIVVAAVRLRITGVEERGRKERHTHLHLTRTIAGQSTREEETTAAVLNARAEAYLLDAARAHPIAGMPLPTTADGAPLAPRDISSYGAGLAVSPVAGATTPGATCPRAEVSVNSVPLQWKRGARYEYTFELPALPPWLPPSYYFKKGKGRPHLSMTYTVSAFVDESRMESHRSDVIPTVSDSTFSRSNSGSDTAASSSFSPSAGASRRGSGWMTGLRKGREHRNNDSSSSSVVFTVLSVVPMRQVLQCHERSLLSPPFSQRLVFHVYKFDPALTGIRGNHPYTSVEVEVIWRAGAVVLLGDKLKDNAGGRVGEILRVAQQSGVGGVTVDGAVHHGGGPPPPNSHPHPPGSKETKRLHQSEPNPTNAAADAGPTGKKMPITATDDDLGCDAVLPLQIQVRAGQSSVPHVRVELKERIRKSVADAAADGAGEKNVIVTLASFDYNLKIPAEAVVTFPASLKLPSQFRHSKAEKSLYPPPPGLATPLVTTATWLHVTLPGLHVVPESLMGENMVVLVEDVDLTDTLPYLPKTCAPP